MPETSWRRLAIQLPFAIALAVLASQTVQSGIRGPGKYSGVVIFDRWDTCLLLSGPYITYVSEAVKDELRPYAGKATQVDASEVFQPVNPGDALIRKYKIVGPAPEPNPENSVDGLELLVQNDFSQRGSAHFMIMIINHRQNALEIDSSDFGPTLLRAGPANPFRVSDGRSEAAFTRGDILKPSSIRWTIDGVKFFVSYEIENETRPPGRFRLQPGECRTIRIIFKISPGQYQFMVGYGGGVHDEKSTVSNAISFDVNKSGFAVLAN